MYVQVVLAVCFLLLAPCCFRNGRKKCFLLQLWSPFIVKSQEALRVSFFGLALGGAMPNRPINHGRRLSLVFCPVYQLHMCGMNSNNQIAESAHQLARRQFLAYVRDRPGSARLQTTTGKARRKQRKRTLPYTILLGVKLGVQGEPLQMQSLSTRKKICIGSEAT